MTAKQLKTEWWRHVEQREKDLKKMRRDPDMTIDLLTKILTNDILVAMLFLRKSIDHLVEKEGVDGK